MVNRVATVMGVLFILLGLTGLFFNNLLGMHLSLAHNLIHLATGAASVFIGLKGSRFTAKMFGFGFGFLYLSLGVTGYWLGYNHMETFLPPSVADHAYNQDMFRMIPGALELGTIDHLIHFVIGAIYIAAAALTKVRKDMTEYLEGNPG